MSPYKLFIAEPPSVYGKKPALVVDASVVAAHSFIEPEAETARSWMQGYRLFAPAMLAYELTNVARQKVRRRMISAEEALAALIEFADMRIESLDVPPAEAFTLAHRYDLSGYDASYLWLADHLQAPLATFDAKLGAAAQKHLSGEDPSATG
jgi:predicted nucleic acid-binding protein